MKLIVIALVLSGCVPNRQISDEDIAVFSEAETEQPPETTVEQPKPKIAVTVWMMDGHCAPCERMKRDCGTGNDRVEITYRTGKPPWLGSIRETGTGYPYWEWDNGIWLYSWGYVDLETLTATVVNNQKPAIKQEEVRPMRNRNGRIPIARDQISGDIRTFREAIGPGAVRFRWRRHGGASSFPLGEIPTAAEILGESGEIDIEEEGTSIPDLSAKYAIVGDHVSVDCGPILIPLPGEAVSGPGQCGSIAVVWTIFSVLNTAWQILNPALSIEVDEEIAASFEGGDSIEMTLSGVRGVVRWSFLWGLWRPAIYADVSGATITDESATVRLRSRIMRQVVIPFGG